MVVLAFLSACGSKDKNQANIQTPQLETQKVDTVVKLRDYHYRDTLTWRGGKYAYDVVRRADDSLAVVTDEEGTRHADNYVMLKITRDGEPFFSKHFTKSSFAGLLDAEFKKNGILDGVAFAHTSPEGLRFSFSVSLPDSDFSMPFAVVISSAGQHSIDHDEEPDMLMEPGV